MKLRFYHIRENYVNYLHKVDYRVQMNKNQRRPYVGVVLTVNGYEYFVPMESPKPNHANLKSSGPVFKMDDGKLGIMGFNNMIPVKQQNLISFNIQAVTDAQYQALLQKQLAYCGKNEQVILHRADMTYKKATSGNNPFYSKICCDFKKLERACDNYRYPSKRRNHTKNNG